MNPVLWMTINYRVHCSVNVQQHPVISAPIRQSSIGCESTGQEVMHDNRLPEFFVLTRWPAPFDLPLPSVLTARLLYLLGYRLDVIYLDSAHELGETLVELHLLYQVT